MSKISKELNSILNENKEPSSETKSPKVFILSLILTVVATYFATIYFYKIEDKKNNSSGKIQKILQENARLREKNTFLEKSLAQIKKQEETQTIKKIEKNIVEQKVFLKENSFTKDSFEKLYNSNNSNSFNCYNYEIGMISPYATCLKDLKRFLSENKDAFRFQVIPVISDKESKKYDKFKKNLKELLINGLSTKRVSEVSWHVKKILGKNSIITSNNYFVKSKKGNNGFILKAYLK